MKLYLDTCSIQRPLDTLNQTRLRLEAEAILGILEQVDAGVVELVSSTVLELEIARNSLAMRREHGEQVLRRAKAIPDLRTVVVSPLELIEVLEL